MTQALRSFILIILLTVLLISSGCAICVMPRPVDINNPLKHVAVMPLKNDTTDVDGPNVVRAKMMEALKDRSYIVKDLKETDQILRDQMGITLGGQLEMTTAKKLGETLGVEGVLFGTLMDFDEMTTGLYNVKKVRGRFKLVNAVTGQVMWERGLGVRAEQRMFGTAGDIATIAARVADAKDKDVPWVTIESTTSDNQNLGQAFAIGLGTKLLSKALGRHLDSESQDLARRVTSNLPWGPGESVSQTAPVSAPKVNAAPERTMPEPPSFGFMDWEGKKDFTAVVVSSSLNKRNNDSMISEMPIAIAGQNIRIDMDLSKTRKDKDAGQTPFNKMIMINRSDTKTRYTLYPDVQKFMTHMHSEDNFGDKPKIEKTKVGSEIIGTYLTEKYQVKIIYKDGKISEGFIWTAPELNGLTIRSEVEDKEYRITTELLNIVLSTPASTLFDIPTGYTEARNFMELMMTERKNK